MKINSYAKINLLLIVGSLNENSSFHNIKSVVSQVNLYDIVDLNVIKDSKQIKISCSDKNVPCDNTNTVYKVLESLQEYANLDCGFNVHIEKNIPTMAGLGGGSSNAAYCLVLACQILGLNYNISDYMEIVSELGSDIPLFFYKSSVYVEGTGDVIKPIANKINPYILIVKEKDKGLSTKDVYKEYDNIHNKSEFDSNKLIVNLGEGIYKKAILNMRNDLEYPAMRLCPEIGGIKAKLLSLGFDFVMVSGSGSSIFALTQDKRIINNALSQFDNKIYFVKSCQKIY
ncbi:MAG: 4-(cytidine 5'-diphospho)-2-C-methyl-D-erythritol kinase [Bacilli bacterium]|nr:4-(cytidine 5'-diphospho)-2-C-methyl-D-erythritol kinase [Bacilli bacterium]